MANTPDKNAQSRSPSPSQQTTPAPRPRALPRQWPPPLMGIPGLSAFSPYSRPQPIPPPPSPPQPLPPPPSPSPPPRVPTPSPPSPTEPHSGGVHTAIAVVGGGVSSGGGSGVIRIGGSSSLASRKRARDDPNPNLNPVNNNCSMCGKVFTSPKALFGHMRSHPERGWKGAHPPPTFRAQDEFADLRPHYRPPPSPLPPARAEAEQSRKEAEDDGREGQGYRVPDLNNEFNEEEEEEEKEKVP